MIICLNFKKELFFNKIDCNQKGKRGPQLDPRIHRDSLETAKKSRKIEKKVEIRP
jgi:hypothetical protein